MLQPFKQELSKKTEDKLHLEDVKIRQTSASARDDKKLCLTENYIRTKILHLYLRDLE